MSKIIHDAIKAGIAKDKAALLKPAGGTPTARLPESYRAWVEIGEMRLGRLGNGQLWLTHQGGEGMAISKEGKLAEVLKEFFRREF